MKFVTMGLEPRGEWAGLDAGEMNRRVRLHQQKLDDLVAVRARSGPPGLIFASVGLSDEREVVTVRRERGQHTYTDGPFPETKEVIGGFDIIEFDSRHDAVGWATAMQRHPTHVSEIRPIREFWWISGFVDPVRLRRFERWSEGTAATPQTPPAAGEVFMLTSVENEQAMLRLPESERKQIGREPQRIGAEYVRQRSILTHEPGMWVGARLAPTSEASTIRWTQQGPSVSDRPLTDTTPVIGGFNLVACASLDDAVTWAQKLAQRDGAVIEVRPVRGCWWIYHEQG